MAGLVELTRSSRITWRRHGPEILRLKGGERVATTLERLVELVAAARVELQRLDGHRAVDIDRLHRDSLLLLEPLQPVQHLFDASDRERGNDELASARMRLIHDRRQPRSPVVRLMQPVAVCRLAQQHVRVRDRLRILEHGPSIAPEIPAEDDRAVLAGEVHADGRRAEQMSHRHETDLDTGNDGHRTIEPDRLQHRQRPPCVGDGVKRLRSLVLRVMTLVRGPGVLFLDVGGIDKDELREILGAWRAEHATVKPLGRKPRQVADVIEMRMRQHDGIN